MSRFPSRRDILVPIPRLLRPGGLSYMGTPRPGGLSYCRITIFRVAEKSSPSPSVCPRHQKCVKTGTCTTKGSARKSRMTNKGNSNRNGCNQKCGRENLHREGIPNTTKITRHAKIACGMNGKTTTLPCFRKPLTENKWGGSIPYQFPSGFHQGERERVVTARKTGRTHTDCAVSRGARADLRRPG